MTLNPLRRVAIGCVLFILLRRIDVLKFLLRVQSKKAKKNAAWYKKLRSAESFDDNLREQSAYQQRSLRNDNPNKWKHLARWFFLLKDTLKEELN